MNMDPPSQTFPIPGRSGGAVRCAARGLRAADWIEFYHRFWKAQSAGSTPS
jgi:hypothetical protein